MVIVNLKIKIQSRETFSHYPKNKEDQTPMTKEEWNELKTRSHALGRMLAYEIMDPIREQDDAPILAVPIAYVLLKNLEDGADISSPEAFVESLGIRDEKEKSRKLAFYKGRLERVWSIITEAPARIKLFSGDKTDAIKTLKSMVLFYDFTKVEKNYSSMPESIAELAIRILDLKEDDRVCEYCTGRGTFTVLASQKEPKASYTGIEIDSFLCEITSIRVEVAGGKMDLIAGDVFGRKSETKYTKAFMNYPFARRKVPPVQDGDDVSLFKTVSNTLIKFADWQFIANVIDELEEGGKAVVVTNNGSLNNRYDKEVREIFINRGYIDAVIALPEKLFNNTMIPVTLLVLTKRNAADEAPQTVKMVNASGFCENARYTNIIADEHVDEIIHAYTEETGFGRDVQIEEIKDNDFVLAADRYFVEKVSLSNSREFGDFIVNIKRGTPMKAEELKEIETDEPGCEYLAIGNIVDGYIDHDSVKHIKPNDELAAKLANYQINDGDLIISKGGNPFKIAVADVPEGTKIIASGNLYVIEIDKNKGVPYFFKAFLESGKGRKLLEGAAVGSVISMISAEAIRKLKVPDYPIYEQQKIANEMKEITMTLRERATHYKKIMERLRNKATHICEEWNTEQ